jgi:hypothetical protein
LPVLAQQGLHVLALAGFIGILGSFPSKAGYPIQHLEAVVETLVRNNADARKRLDDTQAQVATPFEYAGWLTELVQRQQEIEDELDLTKNQASGQLGADSPKETPTVEPDADSLKKSYNGDWY